MIRLLRFLITGSWHEHKWKILGEGTLHPPDGDQTLTIGRWYDLQCETCGKLRHERWDSRVWW